MKIDNFALSMHQSCPEKFRLRIKEHWASKGKSAALGAGGAVHSGLAVWYKTGDPVAAIQEIEKVFPSGQPVDDYRTQRKCMEVMAEYIKHYPIENFRVVGAGTANPMVECSFTLDTSMFLNCEKCFPYPHADKFASVCENCGGEREPIQYGGIFDGIIEYGPHVYVLEHKTTSQLGSFYFNQFKPNNQVTGYVWAAGLLSGKKVGGALINAIGMYKTQGTKFERTISTRNDYAIKRWMETDVYGTCIEIQHHLITDQWPRRTQSCTMYGRCEFHDVHTLDDPSSEQKLLEQNFIRQVWDYEDRD